MQPVESCRGAVQMRFGVPTGVYASWPFGAMNLSGKGDASFSVSPRFVVALARLLGGGRREDYSRHIARSELDRVEKRGKLLCFRSSSAGDVAFWMLGERKRTRLVAELQSLGIEIRALESRPQPVRPPANEA
jgi:hypothetical protein